jgi:hypothetical protein
MMLDPVRPELAYDLTGLQQHEVEGKFRDACRKPDHKEATFPSYAAESRRVKRRVMSTGF